MRFQIARAEAYYDKAADLEHRIERDSRPTLIAMTAIYRGLLEKSPPSPSASCTERVSLSLLSKLIIGWRACGELTGVRSDGAMTCRPRLALM